MRQDRQHLYIPTQLASSNRRWYTSWFYLRNDDGWLPPYTGRIVEDCPKKWRYGVLREEQPKLQPLLDGLEKLQNRCLTAAVVMAAFHRRRVLPLMARRRCLFEMRPGEPIEGIRMSAAALSDDAVLCRVREAVDGKMKSGGLTHIVMRPSRGYLSLVSLAPLRPPRPPRSSSFFRLLTRARRSHRG